MIQPFNLLNPAWIKQRLNYAVSLPGGTNSTTAQYGQGPTDARLKLGNVWALEIRHRPRLNNQHYLMKIGWGTTELAIIRGFVANRYEVYAQGASSLRLQIPTDTALNSWNTVRAEYDGTTLWAYLNGILAPPLVKAYSFPDGGSTNPFLLLGTANPTAGSDAGDIDYVQIEKNGSLLCRYDFAPGAVSNQPDSAGILGSVTFTAGVTIISI